MVISDVGELSALFFRAAEIERKLPKAYDLRARGYWPEVPPDPGLAYGYNEVEVRPGPASAAEVTLWEHAISLTKLFEPDDARLVWAAAHSAVGRARGPAWRRIARQLRCHPETARRRFERAILGLLYKML